MMVVLRVYPMLWSELCFHPVRMMCMPFPLQYMNEATWNWRLMKTIMTDCHLYDEKVNYVPFDSLAEKESPLLAFIRRFMPNFA